MPIDRRTLGLGGFAILGSMLAAGPVWGAPPPDRGNGGGGGGNGGGNGGGKGGGNGGGGSDGFNYSTVKDFQAGSTFVLPSETRSDDIVIEFNGSASQPVTLSAVIPFETVFRGNVTIRGNYGILEGVQFDQAGTLRIEGTGHILRDSILRDGGAGRGITLANANGVQINHCSVVNWDNAGVAVTGSAKQCRIQNCLFDNSQLGYTNAAAVQLGLGDKDAYRDLGALIYRCRFARWNATKGADKVLTMKSSGNHVLQCTFFDCDARVQVRFGKDNRFEACILDQTRSLRVLDYNNQVLGCHIANSRPVSSSERGLVVAAGNHPDYLGNNGNVNLPGQTTDGHPNSNQVLLAGNICDYTNIGSGYSGHDLPANATIVRQHSSGTPVNFGLHTNTDYQPGLAYGGTIAPLSILSGSDVGPRL